jgi:hypothetical protein
MARPFGITDSTGEQSLPPLQAFILVARAHTKIDFEDVAELASELESELDNASSEDPDERIAALYEELRALANEKPSSLRNKRWKELTGELRALQEAEARRMREYFDSQRPLGRGLGDAAIRRADELLAKYGHPPSSDRSAEKTD